MNSSKASRASALFAVLLALSLPARAAPAPDLFKGKSLTIYVGSGPGGGYDAFARLIARHLGGFLPGAASVSAENMPGAGSIKAANFLFNGAPRDGSALGVVSPSLAMLDVLGTPGVRFHASAFDWIGRVGTIVNLTFTRDASAVKTIADARKRQAIIATIDDSSPLTIVTRVMNKMAGTRFKLVEGYADSNATLMAVERGEADGTTVSWNTLTRLKRDWIAKKQIHILVQYAGERQPELADVPAAPELALNATDRKIISLYVNSADVGYALLAPPELPGPVLAALRQGFSQMVKDPGFIADARRTRADLSPLSGDKLQAIVDNVVDVPTAIRAEARAVAKH